MKWLLFRVLLKDGKEQQIFIKKLVDNPPDFPFSFNRYYNMSNEPDHIQFRFEDKNLEVATAYVESLTSNEKILCSWVETNIMSTHSALVASKCAVVFMKEYDTVHPANAIVMQEFLHFFFDAIGQSYSGEESLALTIANFWKTRREYRRSLKEIGEL